MNLTFSAPGLARARRSIPSEKSSAVTLARAAARRTACRPVPQPMSATARPATSPIKDVIFDSSSNTNGLSSASYTSAQRLYPISVGTTSAAPVSAEDSPALIDCVLIVIQENRLSAEMVSGGNDTLNTPLHCWLLLRQRNRIGLPDRWWKTSQVARPSTGARNSSRSQHPIRRRGGPSLANCRSTKPRSAYPLPVATPFVNESFAVVRR